MRRQEFEKRSRDPGADDVILRHLMDQASLQYPALENFFLVSGDLDFSRATEELIKNGKKVYVLSLEGSQNSIYRELASHYAGRLTATTIEQILEDPGIRAM